MDIGISTGGFTDVLLRNNALHVLGVDVAYGLLDYQLRKNQKLSLLERTNARYITKKEISEIISNHHLNIEDISLVTIDISFISVFKVLPNLIPLLRKDCEYIILIKPQFESEKHMVDEGGVLSNPEYIKETLRNVETQISENNCQILNSEPSVIKGAKKGNQEYFYHIKLA